MTKIHFVDYPTLKNVDERKKNYEQRRFNSVWTY